MKCNRLVLSIPKTNFILFHSSKLKPNQSLRITIDDAPIKQVDSTKYLGITFDSNLTWKSHINELCVETIKNSRYLVKSETFCQQTYSCHALLLSCLSFPRLWRHVWGLTFPSFLTQLFIIRKKAIRIISFSGPKSHCEPLFKSLNLLKLNDVIDLHILSFVYQWSHRLLLPVSVNILKLHLLFMQQKSLCTGLCQYHTIWPTFPKIHWSSPLEFLAYRYKHSTSLRIVRKTLKNCVLNCYSINYLT